MRVRSNEWDGGTVTFGVPWPPRPEDPRLLRDVIDRMRAEPTVTLVENVTSGPGANARTEATVTGDAFVGTGVYAGAVPEDVRPLPRSGGRRRLTLYLPGSAIWALLEIDRANRLSREVLITPGHRIERTFRYPAARKHTDLILRFGAMRDIDTTTTA